MARNIYLQPGDVLTSTIAGIGSIRNEFVCRPGNGADLAFSRIPTGGSGRRRASVQFDDRARPRIGRNNNPNGRKCT